MLISFPYLAICFCILRIIEHSSQLPRINLSLHMMISLIYIYADPSTYQTLICAINHTLPCVSFHLWSCGYKGGYFGVLCVGIFEISRHLIATADNSMRSLVSLLNHAVLYYQGRSHDSLISTQTTLPFCFNKLVVSMVMP